MNMIIKKKKKRNVLLKLIIIVIIAIISAFFLIKYFSNNITPGLMIYAEDEVTRLTTLVINDTVNNDLIEELDEDKIFEIVRNNNGEIELISYNTKNVNYLLNSIAVMVQNNLKAIEEGNIEFLNLSGSYLEEYDGNLLKQGIVCKIPFGSFAKNTLLSNIGPKIPVRFTLIGDVDTKINSDVKEYGINNALLKVSIEVVVNFRVHLPFVSNKISVSSELPISMKVIQGSIPDFYTGGLQSSFGYGDN